jgi:hypothetical protein
MGRIAVHGFVTLDGVIEDPSWTFDFPFDPRLATAAAVRERARRSSVPYDPDAIRALKDQLERGRALDVSTDVLSGDCVVDACEQPGDSSRRQQLKSLNVGRSRMTDVSGGAPRWLYALIRWKTRGWTTDDSRPAYRIDVLDTRLNEADALRLGRVLLALADAGLIDECHVIVCAFELDGAGSA